MFEEQRLNVYFIHPTSTFQKGFKSTLYTFSAVFYTKSTTFQQKQFIERRLLPVDLHNRYLWFPRSREWRGGGGGGSAHSLRSALSRAQCEPARCPVCALTPRNPASSGLRTGYAHHGSSPLQVAGQGRSLDTLVLSEFPFSGKLKRGTLFLGSLEYKNTIFYNIYDCLRDSRQNFGPIPNKFGKILPLIKLFNGLINLKKIF